MISGFPERVRTLRSASTGSSRAWLVRLLLVALAIAAVALPQSPAMADAGSARPTEVRPQFEAPAGSQPESESPEPDYSLDQVGVVDDPLGLVLNPQVWDHPHSVGADLIEVWVCAEDIGFDEWTVPSPATYVNRLNTQVAPWFEFHSRGRYDPRFIVGSTADCIDQYTLPPIKSLNSSANLVLSIWPWGPCCSGGGAGGPGDGRETANVSGRGAIVANNGDQAQSLVPVDTVHEIGHTLYWNHSYITHTLSYDVVHDVMSGNEGSTGVYGTAVFNYYAAGWIDVGEVAVVPPAGTTVTLLPTGSTAAGKRMAVIPDGWGNAWVFGARVSGTNDAIPPAWQGVEVYHISSANENGFARADYHVTPFGERPPEWDDAIPDPDFLVSPIPHIVTPGQSVVVDGVSVSVSAAAGGYRVVFGKGAPLPEKPPPPPFQGFWDTQGHVFESAINWLAMEGITQGCNPPANFLFCPDHPVTRGQMATFLVRALGLPAFSGPDRFRDDDGHIFEGAIERFAQAGITVGCNPPANDRFCPDRPVTRGQMAAFLVRAFDLPAFTGPDGFRDDDGHVFESAIERLAQAGITVGCNPPANNRFCPDQPVTRGQMAAFLKRAFGA